MNSERKKKITLGNIDIGTIEGTLLMFSIKHLAKLENKSRGEILKELIKGKKDEYNYK